MEQQQFYTYLNTAKKSLSVIRPLVYEPGSTALLKAFKNEVSKILSTLYLYIDIFKKEGRKTEIDTLIILYTNLLRQLDSS